MRCIYPLSSHSWAQCILLDTHICNCAHYSSLCTCHHGSRVYLRRSALCVHNVSLQILVGTHTRSHSQSPAGKTYKVYLKAPCQMFSYHILFTSAPVNPIILSLNSIYSTQYVNWVIYWLDNRLHPPGLADRLRQKQKQESLCGGKGQSETSGLTTHWPPFWQGWLSHSRTCESQLTPVKPGRQVQV